MAPTTDEMRDPYRRGAKSRDPAVQINRLFGFAIERYRQQSFCA
ncbi:hypothetical protein [Accumulibacter sp.]|nr:hypothetical protein [Accumulibacter sp.]